jgi:hypothetical protein
MGATLDHAFFTSRDVANVLLEGMEDAPETLRGVFKDIRVGPQAELLFISQQQWFERSRAGGSPSESLSRHWSAHRVGW